MNNHTHDSTPLKSGVVLEPIRFEMIPHWIIEHPEITGSAIRVYLHLRKRAGADGTAWPSRKRIAADLGVAIKTADTALNVLSKIGAVIITERYDADGAQTSNLYTVRWTEDKKATDDAHLGFVPRRPELNDPAPLGQNEATPLSKNDPTPLGQKGYTNLYKEELKHREPIQVLKRIDHPSLQRNNSPDPFGEFWSAYPRRAAKGAARIAWLKAIKRAPAHVIIQGAWAYSSDPNRDPAFTKHPATWLNSDCWEDDPLPNTTPMTAREIMFKKSDALIMDLQEKEQALGVESSPWKALEQ